MFASSTTRLCAYEPVELASSLASELHMFAPQETQKWEDEIYKVNEQNDYNDKCQVLYEIADDITDQINDYLPDGITFGCHEGVYGYGRLDDQGERDGEPEDVTVDVE